MTTETLERSSELRRRLGIRNEPRREQPREPEWLRRRREEGMAPKDFTEYGR